MPELLHVSRHRAGRRRCHVRSRSWQSAAAWTARIPGTARRWLRPRWEAGGQRLARWPRNGSGSSRPFRQRGSVKSHSGAELRARGRLLGVLKQGGGSRRIASGLRERREGLRKLLVVSRAAASATSTALKRARSQKTTPSNTARRTRRPMSLAALYSRFVRRSPVGAVGPVPRRRGNRNARRRRPRVGADEERKRLVTQPGSRLVVGEAGVDRRSVLLSSRKRSPAPPPGELLHE